MSHGVGHHIDISIHALCEEGDDLCRRVCRDVLDISIHALCEEGDRLALRCAIGAVKFLSTPSARRATAQHPLPDVAVHVISIHALREEGDTPPPSHCGRR